MVQHEASASTLAAMPEHERDAMARTLIGCISRLFENPDVKADYERWKTARKNTKDKKEKKS